MKKYLLIGLVVSIAMLLSCEKDSDDPEPSSNGNLNETDFEFRAEVPSSTGYMYAKGMETDEIHFRKSFNGQYYLIASDSNKSISVGEFELHNSWQSPQEVRFKHGGSWETNSPFLSNLRLTKVDTLNNSISGHFRIKDNYWVNGLSRIMSFDGTFKNVPIKPSLELFAEVPHQWSGALYRHTMVADSVSIKAGENGLHSLFASYQSIDQIFLISGFDLGLSEQSPRSISYSYYGSYWSNVPNPNKNILTITSISFARKTVSGTYEFDAVYHVSHEYGSVNSKIHFQVVFNEVSFE